MASVIYHQKISSALLLALTLRKKKGLYLIDIMCMFFNRRFEKNVIIS